MHSFARGINTRWKNSKQTRWKRLLDVFILLSLIHFWICVWTWAHAHACHLYKISGSIHVWFGNPKQPKKKEKKKTWGEFKSVFHSSASEPQCQWHIFKTTFWHDIKHSEMSTLIEDGSRAAGSLISIFSLLSSPLSPTLQEMLCCHVKVFTVCWQKCHFQRCISLILSEQARDSPANLSQTGVFCHRMMCEFLCLSCR